jgi:hypothetical protein
MSGKRNLFFQIFNSEDLYGEGAGFFGRDSFPSPSLGYEMCGDNSGRNASGT